MYMRELVWVDGRPVINEYPMICTKRQARLALGEANCAILDAAANDPELPWALRESIKSATEWYREAPEIDEFAWVLGLTNEQIDELFLKAMNL